MSVCVYSVGLSIYKIMSSAKRECSLFFSNMDDFYFIFFTNSPGQNLQGIVDRSGESGHPCLVPDHRKKDFSCSLVSMMVVVVFSWMLFIRLRNFLSIPSLLNVFVMKDCLELSNAFKKLMFIYFWEREPESQRARETEWVGSGRERRRHRIWSSLQALSCQHRVQCGACTCEQREHDLNWNCMLNWATQVPYQMIFIHALRW